VAAIKYEVLPKKTLNYLRGPIDGLFSVAIVPAAYLLLLFRRFGAEDLKVASSFAPTKAASLEVMSLIVDAKRIT
jgi:hypothetical protein